MSERTSVRLGELLLQAGAITSEQLSTALALQRQAGGRLGTNLIEIGAIDERALAHVLSQQLNIPSVTAAQLDNPPANALKMLTRFVAERHRAVPLRLDGERLWVALADPTDRDAIQAIERDCGRKVRVMVAPDVLIDFALDKHYGVRRRARVVEVHDAALLEVESLPVFDVKVDSGAVALKLGFLDDAPAKPSRPSPPPIPTQAPPDSTVTADALRAHLLSAGSDDAIFDGLLEALAGECGRLALLLVRSGVLVAQRVRGLDPRSMSLLRIPLADAPALARILDGVEPYVGPLPSELGSLFQEVGAPAGLLLPVTMGRRPLGLIVGGTGAPDLAARIPQLQRIAGMVDLALHIGQLRARLQRA